MQTHTKVYGQVAEEDSIQLVEGFVQSRMVSSCNILTLHVSWQMREVLTE